MGKISKIFLSVCCLLPLFGLVAFAEEEKPSDVAVEAVLYENASHIDEIYVPGFVFDRDIDYLHISYTSSIGFYIGYFSGVDVGDVVVCYAGDDVGYLVFDVTLVSESTNRIHLSARGELEPVSITTSYYLQIYKPINPLNFVSLIGDWIIGCFGTVSVVLTDFASDNEWITLFLLVIPLAGLIFSFVKGLIARR